jgi:hypothetical protein
LDEPKQSLAAWDLVCLPKKSGGLGIVNFQKQNAALLIKFLDKFYNHLDIPWVNLVWHALYSDKIPHAQILCGSYWWRDVMKQVDNFRGVASVKQGRGDTFLFWSDNWKLNVYTMPLKLRFLRLFSFVLEENLSAAEVFSVQDITELFYRPLSVQAFQELGELQRILHDNPQSD